MGRGKGKCRRKLTEFLQLVGIARLDEELGRSLILVFPAAAKEAEPPRCALERLFCLFPRFVSARCLYQCVKFASWRVVAGQLRGKGTAGGQPLLQERADLEPWCLSGFMLLLCVMSVEKLYAIKSGGVASSKCQVNGWFGTCVRVPVFFDTWGDGRGAGQRKLAPFSAKQPAAEMRAMTPGVTNANNSSLP